MNARDLARYSLPVKPDWFDDKLQKIVGLNRFGGLNIRVVWGQDPSLQVIAMGEPRAKYRAATSTQLMKTEIAGDPIAQVWEDKFDIGIPLWFAEVWIPPEEFGTTLQWEKARWKWINGIRTDVLGPFPTFGDYQKWLRFEHKPPKASYWAPNQRMLDIIEHGWKMMQEMKTQSVDDLIIADYKEAARRDEEDENVLRPEFKEFAKDWSKLIAQNPFIDQNPKGATKDVNRPIQGTTTT